MSENNETSLYSNLTQCLRSLRKIRELYKNAPPTILDQLANMEEVIALCQCASLEDDLGGPFKKPSKAYWYILENLIEAAPRRLPLQLYFCKSPYWEHYDRNVSEIMLQLDKILYAHQPPPVQRPRSRKTSGTCPEGPLESTMDIERFQRKYIPFSKVVMDRQWGMGWKGKPFAP